MKTLPVAAWSRARGEEKRVTGFENEQSCDEYEEDPNATIPGAHPMLDAR
jgi:hypothetical protein